MALAGTYLVLEAATDSSIHSITKWKYIMILPYIHDSSTHAKVTYSAKSMFHNASLVAILLTTASRREHTPSSSPSTL